MDALNVFANMVVNIEILHYPESHVDLYTYIKRKEITFSVSSRLL